MRRASIIGPLLLILIGGWFLISSLRPDLPLLEVAARYWPLLLIGWGVLRLLEILVWAARSKPVPQAGLSGGEWIMIVLISVIGSGLYVINRHRPWDRLGVISSRRVEMFGVAYDFTVAEQQKPAGKTPRILLENLRGNLRITGADGDQIKVSGRKTVRALQSGDAERADKQSPLEITTQGEQVVVRTNQDRVTGEQRISTDLEVALPKAASLEVRARDGEFEISDLGGDLEISSDRAGAIRLRNVGGNVRLEISRSDLVRALDVKGSVEISGGRGKDIELENIGGPVTMNVSMSGELQLRNLAKPLRFQSERTELRIERLPGQLRSDLSELSGSRLVGPVHLATRSRDVQLEDFSESLELVLERGDISLRPAQGAVARIDARTQRGRITLALPETARFQLRATTASGEVDHDFGAALRAESEGRGATLRSVSAQGPEITLSTERGSISVRKDTGAPLVGAPKPKAGLEAEAGRARVQKY